MFLGGLVFPSRVVLAQLDTDSTRAASEYDDDFREPVMVDGDSDGLGEPQRREKPVLRLNAQVATKSYDFAAQGFDGQVPKTDDLELTFAFEELERLGLRATDGTPLLVPGDRLVRIEDRTGKVLQTFPDPPGMYLIAARPSGFLGQQCNLLVCTFSDRRQDAMLRSERDRQV